MYFHVTDLCAVKRDNVIFAVTRHGGHLGYFEGGLVLPNSVTWLDRIVVEFSNALLCSKMATSQQELQTCLTSNSCVNYEPSTKKLLSEDDDDDDDDDDSDDIIEPQGVPPATSCNTENKLATDMVAEILRVSASVVYNGTGPVQPQGSEELVDSDGVVVLKSANINHSLM